MMMVEPTSQAEAFTTLEEAQGRHIELIERADALERDLDEKRAYGDVEKAKEILRTRRAIRNFEWRLSATGARIISPDARRVAQSLLEYWSLRQSSLREVYRKVHSAGSSRYRKGPRISHVFKLRPYDPTSVGELGQLAEEVYQSLPESEQIAAKALFLSLYNPDGSTIADEAPSFESAQPFIERGILIESGGSYSPSLVSLAHRGLAEAWPRLAQWLEEDQRDRDLFERISANAAEWKANKYYTSLPSGNALEHAEAYADRDPVIAEYVAAARSKDRRQSLFSWAAPGALLLVLGIPLLLSFFNQPEPMSEDQDCVDEPEAAEGETCYELTQVQQGIVEPIEEPAVSRPDQVGLKGWMWIGSLADPKAVDAEGNVLDPLAVDAGDRLSPIVDLKVRASPPPADGPNIAGEREGFASAGTWVVARGAAQTKLVNGREQYWIPVRLEPTAFVQYASSVEADVVDRIRTALLNGSIATPSAEQIKGLSTDARSQPFDVRFYFEQDAEAAADACRRAARVLDLGERAELCAESGYIRDLSGSGLSQRVKSGTIELWIFR